MHFFIPKVLILFAACFLMSSCGDNKIKQETIVKIQPKTEAKVIRFDQLLKAYDLGEDIFVRFDGLSQKYPAFSSLFQNELLDARDSDRLAVELDIIDADTSYSNLYHKVQETFTDFDKYILPELSQGIENYGASFGIPEEQLPTIYSFIGGFTLQAFVFSDAGKEGVGVGLDMFLSSDFPYSKILAKNPSFSEYLVRSYNKDHLVKKVVEVLVEDKMPPPAKSDFLNLMIWGGKKLYIMDQILNFVPDTIITEYSKNQLEWCRENEYQMWNHFFDNDLFYQTDLKKISKLIGPSPTSPGMPPESPGRTGNYMGWKVIESFMKRNPDLSIHDLLKVSDAQEILNKAKFRPNS